MSAAAPGAPLFEELLPVESQQVFITLLNTLSRPGTLGQLPSPRALAELPFPLFVPLALADVDVSLAVLAVPDGPDWGGALAHLTGARRAPLQEADIVVALRQPNPDELRSLRRGTADAPERGARLVVACSGIMPGAEQAPVFLTLSGPGVAGRRRLGLTGISVEVIETLVMVNRKPPLGVDSYFVTPRGAVVGLPRTTHIHIEEGSASWATQR